MSERDRSFQNNPNVIHLETVRKERQNKSRLEKLKGAKEIAFGVAALGLVWGVVYAEKHSQQFNGPTSDQKQARELFLTAEDNSFVHDLTVGEEGVNLRDKPKTDSTEPGDGGEIEGFLKPGQKIEKAILVNGNNPQLPDFKDEKALWYAFPDPKRPQRIVFASKGQFEPDSETLSVKPQELK